MNILVTGGAGFIGSNLVDRLLAKQSNQSSSDTVVSLDNYYTGRRENLSSHSGHPNFLEVDGDVTHSLLPKNMLSKNLKTVKIAKTDSVDGGWQSLDYDQIYHLACPASPVHYQKDPIQTLRTSVLGMLNVAEFALAKNARLVFTSTSEVYGDPLEHPQRESYLGNVNPIGVRACYDEGKRAAETVCFDYHRQNRLNVGVVRIFNTYGRNMVPEDGRVVSNFILQSMSGQDITVYGDGNQTRSFCHVDDMVDGLIAMMSSDITGPVNLGSPDEKTVRELADIIIEMTGSSSKVVHRSLPSDDPVKRRPDISLAKQYLNWEPRVDLREGIAETIEYFRGCLDKLTEEKRIRV